MEVFKTFKGYAPLRKAIAQIVSRNQNVMELTIYKIWYELCKTMMSTKEQDDAAIQKFEDNINELRRQIHNLIVVDPPLSGDKNPLQLPTKLKWFTLLSDVLVNTLKLWRCFYDVAEDESVESFHPRRNKMSKRYCQVRGKRRNELIMKALQFESASWIWEGIQDMLKDTKSKRAKVVRTQQPTTVEAPEEEEDDEEQEEEVLLDWELRMNECPSLRVQDDFEHEDEALRSAYMKMDTRIHICCGCRKRFIGERALKIHQNERHNIKSEDTDTVDGTIR